MALLFFQKDDIFYFIAGEAVFANHSGYTTGQIPAKKYTMIGGGILVLPDSTKTWRDILLVKISRLPREREQVKSCLLSSLCALLTG